jgi:hypothetical protein
MFRVAVAHNGMMVRGSLVAAGEVRMGLRRRFGASAHAGWRVAGHLSSASLSALGFSGPAGMRRDHGPAAITTSLQTTGRTMRHVFRMQWHVFRMQWFSHGIRGLFCRGLSDLPARV